MEGSVFQESGTKVTRWPYLAVGSLGMLFAGILYAWSILKVPLENFGWTTEELALNYTITMCFFCLGSLAGGALVKRWPVKLILAASGFLICAGLVMVSRLDGSSILMLYLSYGVITGLGIGVAYNTLLSVPSAWFPDKKGTCSGALMMCFSLSTMVLGQVASRLFEMPQVGWRTTFLGLGIAVFVVMLLCSVILRKPGPEEHLPKAASKSSSSQDEEFEPRDYSAAEVVRRPTFWIFYVYGLLGATVGSVVISFARELALSLGAQAALATTLVGVLSIFNGVGRIICGVVFDTLGRRKTMFAVSVLTVIAPAVMLVALFTGSLAIGIVAFCLTGVSYSCYPTISSAFIATFYGQKDFSLNYSISNTKLLFSSFAATLASTLLAETGSYIAPFVMLLVFAIVAFFLNFSIKRP